MQDTGIGYRAPGTGYLIPDTQYLTRSDAEDPTPSTEDRAWGPGNGKRAHRVYTMQDRKGSDPGYLVPGLVPALSSKNAHTEYASCIHTYPVCGFLEDRYQVSGTGYLAPGTWYPAPEPNRRRRPDTEHRGPSPATGKRAHRVYVYPA
jgi:hypothetical protein